MTKLLENNLFVVFFLIMFTIISLIVLCVTFSSTLNRIAWHQEIYRVKSGDTLWSLSGKYCPDIVDRREWIEEIKDLNDLKDSTLYAGQFLKVLAPGEDD